MKKLIALTLFVCTALVFVGCSKSDQKENSMLRKVSGRPGEVLIISTKAQWNGQVGMALRTKLEQPVYGLPQAEPQFTLIRTNESDFERIFETFRNVVWVSIDTNRMSKGEIKYYKSPWAKGQLVVKMSASSRDELIDLFHSNADDIIQKINTKEYNRLHAEYKKRSNKAAIKKAKKFGVNLAIPKSGAIATQDEDHIWVRVEREKKKGGYMHQISQGLLIVKIPYTNQDLLADSIMLKMRDAKLKKYVPGPSDGSYMTTEYRYVEPVISEIDYGGKYAKQIRGLWRVENDFMGGPMVTYYVLNEKEQMIYLICGYAFAPQFDKREYLREIDAMARTVVFQSDAS
jgi:hypothetical protein